MRLDADRVDLAESSLYALLGAELDAIVAAVNDKSFQIVLPDVYGVDLGPEEIASLVARTSNIFGKAARFGGIARAEAKLAKGRLERKYKRSRAGGNDAEREKTAMAACEVEHKAASVAEAIAELADSVEVAARVASESARRMQASVINQLMASGREIHGAYRDSDFKG